MGYEDVAVGRSQFGYALVERVDTLLHLQLVIGLILELGEAGVLRVGSRISCRRVPGCEGVAGGGERSDRKQRHEGCEWELHGCL